MDTTKNTTKKFLGLTNVERSEIAILLSKNYSLRSIAKVLGRSPNTISYEIKNNSVNGDYDPIKAKNKSRLSRRKRRWQWMKITCQPELQDFIVSKLKVDWSPEEISGYLKVNPEIGFYVSAPGIYKWLYSSYAQRYCQYLYSKRFKPKPKRPKPKRDMIPNRVSIAERPVSVELRDDPGHYEFDSVVSSKRSRSKHAMAVVQERSTRLIKAAIVTSLKPKPYASTIAALVRGLKVSSLTTDNGIENKYHKEIVSRLKDEPTIYFTDPYSSWQKGGVENANKMLRRYFPKGTDFSKIKQTDVDHALTRINNKPRKILGYKSALQVAKEKGLFIKSNKEIHEGKKGISTVSVLIEG